MVGRGGSGWKGKVVCGLQSNLTNGFLNKYGSLICNQKDMRMAEATTAEEELRKCMPMAVGGHGQVRARVGGEGAELVACNLAAQSANRCHYKRKPQAKQANAEGEAKTNTACEEGLGV